MEVVDEVFVVEVEAVEEVWVGRLGLVEEVWVGRVEVMEEVWVGRVEVMEEVWVDRVEVWVWVGRVDSPVKVVSSSRTPTTIPMTMVRDEQLSPDSRQQAWAREPLLGPGGMESRWHTRGYTSTLCNTGRL